MKTQAFVEVKLTRSGIAKALRELINDHLDFLKPDNIDDLYTDTEGNSYWGDDADMQISIDQDVFELVDAYNILRYGHALKVRGLK